MTHVLSRVVVVLASVSVLGLSSVPSSTAEVSPVTAAKPERHHRTFTRTVTDFNSRRLVHLHVCVHFNYRATFKVRVMGTTGNNTPPHYDIWAFQNPRMINPSLDVYVTKTCAFGSRRVNISSLTTKTMISASALTRNFCNLNPSISISAKWVVSVGVAPTCGSKSSKRATRYRTLSPAKPHSRFHIATTGVAATWQKTSQTFTFRKADKDVQLCYRGRYYVDAANVKGTRADDITIPGTKDEMCLPVAYWAWQVTGRTY
jgi:hypothetical protein